MRRPKCVFCRLLASFTYDMVAMCEVHFSRFYLALRMDWTD